MRMYASVFVCVCVTFKFEYLDKPMNARKQNAHDLVLVYSNSSTISSSRTTNILTLIN